MKRSASVVIVGLAVAVGIALAPAAALAGRSGARSGGGRVGVPVTGGHFSVTRVGIHSTTPRFGGPHVGVHHVGVHSGARPFTGHQGFHGRHVSRHGSSVVLGGAPIVYYTPPVGYGAPVYDPPVYDDSPIIYAPNASGSVALAPSSNVVQYSTGRYELRGDGMTTPYTWVWIPNPPPGPPDVPPPDDPRPSRRSKLYRWTDEQGVVHWTDAKDSVPQAYRGRE
jgi:hypothetical protein